MTSKRKAETEQGNSVEKNVGRLVHLCRKAERLYGVRRWLRKGRPPAKVGVRISF